MNGVFSWEAFCDLPVVGILRGFGRTETVELCRAAWSGGLRNLEVTMNSHHAAELIGLARDAVGDQVNVGAGTVCSLESLEEALAAGAEFIVTPIIVPEVIEAAKERDIPIFPGALTPTEIFEAWRLGASVVKVFPGSSISPRYVSDLKAVFRDIKVMPTGGVEVESLADYVRAGADAFGVGSSLFPTEKVSAHDWEWIETKAQQFRQAYLAAAPRS